MATDSIGAGLFQDPQQYQQAMLQQQMKQNYDIAGMSPEQQVTGGLRTAGYQLGGAIGGLMGAQDPQMQVMGLRKQLAQGKDLTSSAGWAAYAQELQAKGDLQGAAQAAQKSTEIQSGAELKQAKLAQASELQTQKDQAALEREQLRIQANIDAAKARGESEERIARMTIEGRMQMAQMVSAMKGEKPLTEYQGKAVTFGTRAAEASNILNNLEGEYSSVSANYLPSFLNSTKGQQAIQAQQNFVNAVLRQESGAAINSSEFENARKQYFPQPGDKPEVIAQKKRNREMVINGFTRQAGPGGADIKQVFDNPPPKAGKTVFNSVAEAEKANLPKGTIITIGGKQAIVE